MASTDSPSIPDDTFEELMEATIIAVSKKGYANIGVRDIDVEFSKSRQLINHYFDGKDDLITELLVYILEYDDEYAVDSRSDDPLTRLNREIDHVLLGTNTDSVEFWTFMSIIYEIQAHAQHNPEHRSLIQQMSDGYVENLRKIIQDGINQGIFHDVDTERVARIIDDLIAGAHIRKISFGQDNAPAETRETIDQFVIPQVVVNPSTETPTTE